MPVSQKCLEETGPRSSTCLQVSLEWLETRTNESEHACKFLGSLTHLEPTAMGGELWFAFEGTGVSTGGRAHGAFVCGQCGRTKESNTCVQFFCFRESLERNNPT